MFKSVLEGIQVLDLTSVILGAYATQMLGDLGADIIKIEAPGDNGGDVMRWAGKGPNGPQSGMGPLFMAYNRNKKSVCLDLRTKEDQQKCLKLAEGSLVFATNIRQESLKKLGLDYDSIKKIRPDVIYVHAVGFGAGGAYEGLAAYDDLVQASSGIADLQSLVDKNPNPRYMPTLIADKTVALFMAQATLAALFHHQRTGEGQYVEVPMLECMTHFVMSENMFGHLYEPPTGDWGYNRILNPNRKPYKTKDGYIALMPYARHQWVDFMTIAGHGNVMDNPKFATHSSLIANIEELYGWAEKVAIEKTTQEWFDLCKEKAIPAMRINHINTIMQDPHLQDVNFFQKVEHPSQGTMYDLKHPVNYEKTPCKTRMLPPLLGQHSQEVLNKLEK